MRIDRPKKDTKMASSSSNSHFTVNIGEEYTYPYPSHVCAPNFVTFKLSGRDEYGLWKTQMLGLLESHDMLGFIDGTLVSPETTSVSGKEKVGDHQTHYRLWRRSDALVKGWILGSLSKETLTFILDRLTEKRHQVRSTADFSAKDVWDEVQTMYATVVLPRVVVSDRDILQDQETAEDHKMLYRATVEGELTWIHILLRSKRVTLIDKITNNGNTALHLAVGNKAHEPIFLQKLLEMTPENTQLSDVKNSDGSTPLHVAAIVGNTEAAKILVARDRELLFAKDNQGQTALGVALSNMHNETSKHLLQYINTDIEKDALFSGATGDELLVTVISSKDFRLANDLVKHYRELHSDAVLMALAQNFPSNLNIFEYIGTGMVSVRVVHALETYIERDYNIDTCLTSWVYRLSRKIIMLIGGIFMLFMLIPWMLVWPFTKERIRIYDDAVELLENLQHHFASSYHHYYTNPMFEAARQNLHELVQRIVYYFPNAIFSANEDGHNIIQYAVINRSEKVYNLLYQMSEHRNIYRTIKDSSGNNLLHLAARLAPSNKLNLISGAALQIQRELQWFKEVERFVCPLSIIQKNSSGKTPKIVFTREHKDLVIEGEKWMKSTANSYTITATLIITIVFAAAITVPGGSNQETGIPIYTNNTAFTIFAISDAISLFAAVTSLLMFLSILTARFAEQDFLFKLPTKLIIGLATLFISTTAMVVAFAATLYLVFGQRNSTFLIPIAVLTCLPITSFVTLQFPLVLDLMSATYGRSIFRKERNSIYWWDRVDILI